MAKNYKSFYEYLCNDPDVFNIFANYSMCLANRNYIDSLLICIKTFSGQIRNITDFTRLDKICEIGRELVECYNQTVHRFCVPEFSTVMSELYTRSSLAALQYCSKSNPWIGVYTTQHPLMSNVYTTQRPLMSNVYTTQLSKTTTTAASGTTVTVNIHSMLATVTMVLMFRIQIVNLSN